ncbi:MFS transporter [Alicyclobacillus acidoterrestris]|uniref:MFS transporter n=1 Tax=Alicyclobacillus acidoterrestris TaxID=1450 RepID=UPI003F5338C4
MANLESNIVEVHNKATRTKVRWTHITITLAVIWVVGMIDKIGVAVVATNSHFLQDMNLVGRNEMIGSLTSALLFSYGIGFFLWGWLTDRFGPKRCAIVGLSIWGVSTLMAAVSPNFSVLFISRIVLGFSEAFLWPVSNALTARWFPLDERGRAKSIWINGVSLGSAIAGFVVTALISLFDWRGVFWFLTIVALVICVPLLCLLITDTPARHRRVSTEELLHIERNQRMEESVATSKNALRTLNYWLVVIAFTGNILAVYGLGSWFPSYMAVSMHFSPTATSTYMLITWSVSIAMMFWVGAHTDRTHKKAYWIIVGFLVACVFLGISLNSPAPIADALLVGGAIAFIQAFTTPMLHGLLHDMSPTRQIGRNTGVMTGIANVVAAFGPAMMGTFITIGHGSYRAAFLFLIICFVLSAVCAVVLTLRGK